MKKLQAKGVKFKDLLDLDVLGISRPREELFKVRGRLAKEANRRMTMLEKTVSPITGEPYTYGAYENYAMRYLSGGKQKRFTKNSKASDKALVHEIHVLQKFLKAPSSKVSEMIKFEQKAQDMFKSKGLKRTTTKTFYKFITSGIWQQFRKIMSSDELVEIISEYADKAVDYNKMQKLMREYLESEEETNIQNFKDFIHNNW